MCLFMVEIDTTLSELVYLTDVSSFVQRLFIKCFLTLSDAGKIDDLLNK